MILLERRSSHEEMQTREAETQESPKELQPIRSHQEKAQQEQQT